MTRQEGKSYPSSACSNPATQWLSFQLELVVSGPCLDARDLLNTCLCDCLITKITWWWQTLLLSQQSVQTREQSSITWERCEPQPCPASFVATSRGSRDEPGHDPNSRSQASFLPSELIPISCLHERHQGVGDGGPDVGPHDDGDGSPHSQHCNGRKGH